MTMKNIRIHAVNKALALMFATLGLAHAADAPLGSASVAVNGLRYRLIDLDPNDGIAPSLTLNGGWSGSALAYGSAEPIATLTSPYLFGTQAPFTTSVDSGTLEFGSDHLLVSSSLSAGSLNVSPSYTNTYTYYNAPIDSTKYQGVEQTYVYSSGSAYQGVGLASVGVTSGDPASINDAVRNLTAVLSPKTLLVIEGTIDSSVTANRAALMAAGAAIPGANPEDPLATVVDQSFNGKGRSAVDLSISLASVAADEGAFDSQFGNTTVSTVGFSQGVNFDEKGFIVGGAYDEYGSWVPTYNSNDVTATLSTSKPFLLSLANTGTKDRLADLSVQGTASNEQSFNGAVTSQKLVEVPYGANYYNPGSNVPEPGTYMLMGLGLVGLTLAKRRRS
jgi:hypothetical protein